MAAMLTQSLLVELLTGKQATEVRRKPGRWIVRTTLPDAAGRVLPVVLKVYDSEPGWKRRLSALAGRLSPAETERRNLEWASAQGIAVPRLVGTTQISQPGLPFSSVFVTEELSDMEPLNVVLSQAAAALGADGLRAWKKEVINEIARLAAILHRSNRYHKDLYLSHFFLPRTAITDRLPVRGRVRLLDFLRLKHHRWNRRRWQVKDLAQLLYSSELPGISDRDRIGFMHAYLQCGKLDRPGRSLIKAVARKARRYRRKNRTSAS